MIKYYKFVIKKNDFYLFKPYLTRNRGKLIIDQIYYKNKEIEIIHRDLIKNGGYNYDEIYRCVILESGKVEEIKVIYK